MQESSICFAGAVGGTATPYRDGSALVVPAGCRLPAFCVKCGAVPAQARLTKTFRWHTPWYYLLLFLGVIVYWFVARAGTHKVRIDVPLCQAHRSWRSKMNVAGALLILGSIPTCFFLAAIDFSPEATVLTGIGLVFSGLVVLGIVGGSFKPVYIDERIAKFRGAGEEFLSLLPSLPESRLKTLSR